MATNIHEIRTKNESKEATYADLAAQHAQPCISLYTSDCFALNDAQQCLPRLKKMLRNAESAFQNAPMTAEEAEKLLESNWLTMGQSARAHLNAQGLALFMSRDFFGYCHLPAPIDDQVAVGRNFLVRPLLPLVPTDDRFFVLALSQKHVRLFECSRSAIRERTMQDFPGTFREDLDGLHFERQYQMHTASSPATRQKGAIFHGPSLQQKDRLIHFFRNVDRSVAYSLKGQQAPLIVAAVDYLFPIYQEANTYPHLLDEEIGGNPDLWPPNTLHAAAWKIVEKRLREAGARAFAMYNEHVNTPLTSTNLREILAAAEQGLVRFLFLAPTGERWGRPALPETVHVHAKEEPGDEDLLNLAAILTLRHGGLVHVVPREELREGADLAAVFRFGKGSQAARAS
ncbi:MAG TPA: hypothetical protein VGR97_05885 [Candidatus Acidoferrales bacterium]|nr:hypothetical protein [Candidatus Acidoferrales bacterium]